MSDSAFNFNPAEFVSTSIGLLALACLVGIIASGLWLLHPRANSPVNLTPTLLRLLGLALLTLLVTNVTDIIMRTTDLTEVNPLETWPLIPKVVRHSLFGHIWVIRFGIALALVFVWIGWKRGIWDRLWIVGLGTIAIIFFFSATTHAGDNGSLTLHNLVNTLHISSGCLWGGSVAIYAIIVLPHLRRGHDLSHPDIADTASRLSSLAGAALAGVLATGVYNAWTTLPTLSSLWTTNYGRVLIVKLAMVSIMVSIGAINRFLLVPAIRASIYEKPSPADSTYRFLNLLRVDTTVFVVILACAVILSMQMPPTEPMPANMPMAASDSINKLFLHRARPS